MPPKNTKRKYGVAGLTRRATCEKEKKPMRDEVSECEKNWESLMKKYKQLEKEYKSTSTKSQKHTPKDMKEDIIHILASAQKEGSGENVILSCKKLQEVFIKYPQLTSLNQLQRLIHHKHF